MQTKSKTEPVETVVYTLEPGEKPRHPDFFDYVEWARKYKFRNTGIGFTQSRETGEYSGHRIVESWVR